MPSGAGGGGKIRYTAPPIMTAAAAIATQIRRFLRRFSSWPPSGVPSVRSRARPGLAIVGGWYWLSVPANSIQAGTSAALMVRRARRPWSVLTAETAGMQVQGSFFRRLYKVGMLALTVIT